MFIVMTDSYPGYWGKGETPEEALDQCKRHHGRTGPWLVFDCDPWWDEVWVDGLGSIRAQCSEEKAAVPHRERPPVVRDRWRRGVRGKITPLVGAEL